MPRKGISPEAIREIIGLVEEALRAGYRPPDMPGGGHSAVGQSGRWALERGLISSISTWHTRLYSLRQRGIEPDWTLYRRPEEMYGYAIPLTVEEKHAPPETTHEPESEPQRVLVIGDAHADPRQNLRRFHWLGRLIGERRPPHVIQIGDFGSFDSVSGHEAKGSRGAMARPSIENDFAAVDEALRRMHAGSNGYKPKLDIVLGNHEQRIERYENLNTEIGNTLSTRRDEIFARWGWRTREYGSIRYVGGVAFTHAPLNLVGKPYGGKTSNSRAGNDTLHAIVRGHDHKREIACAPKIGGVVDVVSVGCALEWGWVEPYAKHNPTGWWWGACEMTIAEGRIYSMDWIDMLTLRRRYSDDGADTRTD